MHEERDVLVVEVHFTPHGGRLCERSDVCGVFHEVVGCHGHFVVRDARREDFLDRFDVLGVAALEAEAHKGRELGGHARVLVDAEVLERARQQRDEVVRAAVLEDAHFEDEGAVRCEEVERVAGHGDAVEHVPVLVVRPVLDDVPVRREAVVVRDAAPVEDGGDVEVAPGCAA